MITTVVLCQALSGASLSGVRAVLALLVVAGTARLGNLPLPPALAWLASDLGLAALVGLLVVEELGESDEDAQELLEILHYAVRGTGGAVVAWSFSHWGTGIVPDWVLGLVGGTVAAATHHLRAQLHEALRGFGDHLLSPRSWLTWLERGGVVGLAAALVLAPNLALAFVVVAGSGAGLALLLRRAADRRLWRRPCPACGFAARTDASVCPACRTELPVLRWHAPAPRDAAPRGAALRGGGAPTLAQ